MAKGGYKGSSPARETSPEEYSGVWDITEQFDEQKAGSWPFQEEENAPRSVALESSAEQYFTKTIDNITTFTFSFWVKRHGTARDDLFVAPASTGFFFYIHTDGQFRINTNTANIFGSNGYYRDPTAWYHVVISKTASTFSLFVNGVLDKSVSITGQLSAGTLLIGRDRVTGSANHADVSLAELNFIDGQALSCNEFGFFDGAGVWQPKRFTGDYSSGPVYSNNASATGGFESSHPAANGFNGVLTAGNRANGVDVGGTIELTFNPGIPVSSSVGIWSGKSGFKYQINNSGSYTTVTNATEQWHDASFSGTLTNLKIQHSASNEAPGFSGLRTDGTMLVDPTFGRHSFHVDFSNKVADQSGLGNDLTAYGIGFPGESSTFTQIKYSGTNNSNPITGTGFRPDFVWIKRMSSTNAAHSVYSSTRGVTKSFDFDNNTGEKTNDPQSFVSFDADGFTVSGTHNQLNSNGNDFASFSWKAGGPTETSHSASTAAEGSIASHYSAGEYFSIVRYEGTGSNGTVKHGLDKKPKWVVVTPITAGDRRRVYHEHMDPSAPHNYYANLDLDQARTAGTAWNGAFTDKVFTVGTDSNTNMDGRDYIAWCWAEEPGRSKFGVYDGSSNPVTVNVGFAPDWVMIKCVGTNGAGQEWIIKSKLYDDDEWLQAEQPLPLQSPGRNITWNDNGFTVAAANGPTNYTGRTLYIYSAFKTGPLTDNTSVDSCVNGTEASANGGERRGNYATINPLNLHNTADTVSDGNLKLTSSGSGAGHFGRSTVAMTSGKYYCELTWSDVGKNFCGIQGSNDENYNNSYVYLSNAKKSATNGNSEGDSYGASWGNGDTIGIAFDADNGTLTFYKNGATQGTAFTGIKTDGGNGTYAPYPSGYKFFFGNWDSQNCTVTANFGQKQFKQAIPTGFSPLASSFLPEPAIKRGDEHMDVSVYTGNGAIQTIDGFSISPDLVWAKRTSSGGDHQIFDHVRGVQKGLTSDQNDAEWQYAGGLSAFNSDGFSVGSLGGLNGSGDSQVAWMWDAGEATTTIAAGGSNTSAYLQGAAYNSQVTGSSQSYDFGGGGERDDDNMFDGNIKHSTAALGANNDIVWAGSIPFTSSFGIASDNDGAANAINITHGPSNTVTNVRNQVPNTINSQIAAGSIPITTLTGITSPVTRIELVGGATGANGLCMVVADGKFVVDNTITPTNVPEVECKVRANRAAGFSIVKVDNPTNTEGRVHGLSKAPEFFICKSLDSADSWHTYWKQLGKGYYINIFPIGAKSASDQFGSQEPNDTSFYVKPNTGSGANKANGMIYYLWHSVEGYSKFSSYTGTGGNVFVYCGFRPRVITIKNADQSNNWLTYDTARNTVNPANKSVQWDDDNSDTAVSNDDIDILSNGFCIKATRNDLTRDGDMILFGAWAEHPFAMQSRAR